MRDSETVVTFEWPRLVVEALATLIVLSASACAVHAAGPRPLPDATPLLTLPDEPIAAFAVSADGGMFVATLHATHGRMTLRRALVDSPALWTTIVELPPTAPRVRRIYAPRRDVLYAITSVCNKVFRWTEDSAWQELDTPIRDSVWRETDVDGCLYLRDVSGSGTVEVYVVGAGATVLRYDGSAWQLESNPLHGARAASRDAEAIVAVSAHAGTVYAVTHFDLLRRTARAAWDLAERRPPAGASRCVYVAVAAQGDGGALIGGSEPPCLLRFDSSGWRPLSNPLPRFRAGVREGRTQADGSALFWSEVGDIAEVRGAAIATYRAPGLTHLAGAAALGDFIYVAGTTANGAGQVSRAKRP